MKVHLHRPIIDRLIHHVSILVDSNTIGQAVWYNEYRLDLGLMVSCACDIRQRLHGLML